MMREFNEGIPIPLRISTHTDAPPGSGLGSSSTLVVALVTAFAEYFRDPLGQYEIAQLACEIERLELRPRRRTAGPVRSGVRRLQLHGVPGRWRAW